jgi:hypothetical protein
MSQVTGDSNPARLCEVFVLPMAASGGYLIPSILFYHFDRLSHFHKVKVQLPNSRLCFCILPESSQHPA